MKAKVSKDLCIGCGACTTIAPDVFEFDDDGLAKVIKDKIDDDEKDDVVDASESCPTEAIEIEENN